jgi:hypothetical protein
MIEHYKNIALQNDPNLPDLFEKERYEYWLYHAWQNEDQRPIIFGNIPIDPNGVNGFTTSCPPIPWMGNIENAEYALVSLEPLLDPNNFQQQIQATGTHENWAGFYFQNYFQSMFGENGLQQHLTTYWRRKARLFLTQNHIDQIVNDAFLLQTLQTSIVEFPFVQYHAQNHPGLGVENFLSQDLQLRISFLPPQTTDIVIYGFGVRDLLIQQLQGHFQHMYDILFQNLIPVNRFSLAIGERQFNVVVIPQLLFQYNLGMINVIHLGDFIREQFH